MKFSLAALSVLALVALTSCGKAGGSAPDPTNTASGSCSGTQVSGYCWYAASAAGTSCTTTCTAHGGVNMAGGNFISASDANCDAVGVALNYGDGSTISSGAGSWGCGYSNLASSYERGTSAFDPTATHVNTREFCPCNS
jgi:hypothetical protein